MSHAIKPPARTQDLTVLFTVEEKDDFRRKCAQIGSRCGTEARRILNAWDPLKAPMNIKLPRKRMEYPVHGHIARPAKRVVRGGAPRPSRV